MRDHFQSDWPCRRAAERTKPVRRVVVLATAALAAACGATGSPHAAPPRPVLPVQVSAAQLARLPTATTFGTTPGAPQDPDPFGPETGIVLHPTARQVIYARPGGPAVAALPVTELRNPTWTPVVQLQPGWDRVLLPSRPNRSTGWIYTGDGGVRTAYSPYQVEVDLATYRLTVIHSGRTLGSWTEAEGAAATPTPTGRTFLLASLAPEHPTYSPLILPLGLHSDTLSTFGGGPGTVGLHGWPDPAVFGHAVSHGCVRVPAAALRILSRVPLGSSVVIVG
jgi:lipoprotein-anchoring transpeptidase ErfK/SrfK